MGLQTLETRVLSCGHVPSAHGEHTTGTAYLLDGKEICWECCATHDKQSMIDAGTSRALPLYVNRKGEVMNWPGTLRFTPINVRRGRHNFGVQRTDVWFNGPDGFVWHGVNIGDYTDILHARRTKQRSKQ